MLPLFSTIVVLGVIALGWQAAVAYRVCRATGLRYMLFACGALGLAAATLVVVGAAMLGLLPDVDLHGLAILEWVALAAITGLLTVALVYGVFAEYDDVRRLHRAMRVSDWMRGQVPPEFQRSSAHSSAERREGVAIGASFFAVLLIYVLTNDFLLTCLRMGQLLAYLWVGWLAGCCLAIIIASLVLGKRTDRSGTDSHANGSRP